VREELLTEAVVVGLSTVVAGNVLRRAGMNSNSNLFWFTLGVVTHVGWEALGGNRWYVETRDANTMPRGIMAK
jgi:hypothetical protein